MILGAYADMTPDRIDFAKARVLSEGIADSGEALEAGIGAMSDATIEGFFDKMVEAGVIEPDVDWRASYGLELVIAQVGMTPKP